MSKLKNFASKFAGKGYYIALILCAVTIGISGYLYYQNANQTDTPEPGGDGVVDVLNPGGSSATGPTVSKPTIPTGGDTKPQALKTCCPVAGSVVMEYAMDCLCYNPTTRDWRVHDGIDYAAEAGTQVLSAAEGTVYSVHQDDTMGYTVVITHRDGYVTTYSSLDANILVKAGDTVKLGQPIGYVGSTAVMESAIGDHVHFNVTCNGESMDPEDFFQLN